MGSAGITAKCPNKLNGGHGLTFLVTSPGVNDGNSALASAAQQASFAQCLVDVEDITKSLFKDMNKHCEVGAERLYQLENGDRVEMQSASGSSVTLALAALLPITAVLAFVGGSRFAKARVQPADDHAPLVE